MEQEAISVIGPVGICAVDGGSRKNEAQGQTRGNHGTAKLWGLKH